MSVYIEGHLMKALLFDADGTFYDLKTQRQIFEQPRVAIASHLHTSIEEYVALAHKRGSFARAFVEMGGTHEDYVRLSEIDKSQFLRHDPELLAMILTLRAHAKLAVLTSTTESSLESIGKTMFGPDWRTHFEVIVASDTPGISSRKPDPSVFIETLNLLGTKPFESVMIGDSDKSDMVPAVTVGLLGIQVENTDSTVAHHKIPSVKHLINLIAFE